MNKQTRTSAAWLVAACALALWGCDSAPDPVGEDGPASGKSDQPSAKASACAMPMPPAEPLEVATEGAFPPFNDLDDDGNPIGWEMDYLELVMERVGVDYTVSTRSWDGCCEVDDDGDALAPMPGDGLFASTFGGDVDLALASISNNDRRVQLFEFSDRYGFTPLHQEIVFRSADADEFDFSVAGLSAMDGKTIGVQQGTNQAFYMERLDARPELSVNIVLFERFDEAVTALQNADVDAVYGFSGNPEIDAGLADGSLGSDDALRTIDAEGHDAVWGDGAAFMARPDIAEAHPGLVDAINCAIAEIAYEVDENGQTAYERLGETWADGLLYCNPTLSDQECQEALP